MKFLMIIFIFLFIDISVYAQSASLNESSSKMTVYGRKRSSKKITGTRYEIKKSDKEAFNDSDPHRLIQEAPGTYVQDEDGFGLRPNIGIRGTHPHRSKKISLLEDGILLGPAPYSAPAAYYFPQMTKLIGADLIKGSMSSLYGPTSVGGAFNFKTRQITNEKLSGGINLVGGAVRRQREGFSAGGDRTDDRYSRSNIISGHVSQNLGKLSYLVEAGMIDSRGFKELEDINTNTGFDKWDGLLKLKYKFSKNQSLNFKASKAKEVSNETYLGLTESDFNQNPFQRYSASQLDQMDWDQDHLSLVYENKISKTKSLKITAYQQNFRRSWDKLDRFSGADVPTLAKILDDPELPAYNEYYGVLTGELDTFDINTDGLIITDNAREYYSRGLTGVFNYDMRPSRFSKIKNITGLRYHRDEVSRNHISSFGEMCNGEILIGEEILNGDCNGEALDDETVQRNTDQSEVLAAFHQSSYQRGTWTIDANFRLERVFQNRNNFLNSEISNKDQTIFAPGIGFSKVVGLKDVVFAGVHRGMGAAGANPSEGARPEESINYELGYRFVDRNQKFEIAAFATDYQNIKGFCTASSGCDQERLDEEFSGGSAMIYGLEASLKSVQRISARMRMPIVASYTLTRAEFNNSFESLAPNEWGQGQVEKGDPLPYVPEHQLSLSAALNFGKAFVQARWNRRSSVFDQSVKEGRKSISSYQVTDVAMTYPLRRNLRLTASIDNILGEEYIASFRPFGARPGKPRHYKVGLNYKF